MFARRRQKTDLDIKALERSLTTLSTATSVPLDPGVDPDPIGPKGLNLLHNPLTPIIELIFVHGLRGGSRKTWSHSPDPYHYWPKEWLSRDPEFKHARIFSFGYNSDWAKGGDSAWNIHDFAKYLLHEIATSPDIAKAGEPPIIFVGHSMGGIVIKKVSFPFSWIEPFNVWYGHSQYFKIGLTRQDKSVQHLAERMKAIIFLATPHRGADSAAHLEKILQLSLLHGEKPFVSDLKANSQVIEVVNDEFRHHAPDFLMHSFYETHVTNLGYSSALIVKKDSASLGYPNETSSPLDANHRAICKYDTPSNPNFISVRNALVRFTRALSQTVLEKRHDEQKTQLQAVGDYLGITETPDHQLQMLEDTQHPGSNTWFTDGKMFKAWRDVRPGSRPLFCLTAQPATGKSVMASHIIRSLEDANIECSYFFFRFDDPVGSRLSACLRSLAYQWALVDPKIRQRLLELREDNPRLEKDNEQIIWRKIFVCGLLEVTLDRPHYIVIDALDECKNPKTLMTMLSRMPSHASLRVFMTSRPDVDHSSAAPGLEGLLYAQEMTTSDTRADIELYLESQIRKLPLHGQPILDEVAPLIIDKAAGSFLWVSLVLNELRSVFSPKDVRQVIEDVPPGMEPMYERALNTLSTTTKGKNSMDIIQAILMWVVCAIRPLTLEELEQGLLLELGSEILAVPLGRFITHTCDHLIQVDPKTNVVTARHETFTTFLSKQALQSYFAVDKSTGHQRITDVCLKYLNSGEMRPPRSPVSIPRHHAQVAKRSPFSNYACIHFSYHLRRSHSGDPERFMALCKFLTGNVLSWIEHVAASGDIHHLITTSSNLEGFFQARAKYSPPTEPNFRRINRWATDLIHLVSQFGRNLVKTPSAIFWLIPPFCPPQTGIRGQFNPGPNGIKVCGLSAEDWNDRISCIYFPDRQAKVVATENDSFAVGLSDKTVRIMSRTTCQEEQQLNTSESAKLLAFGLNGKFLAASTVHFLELHRLDGGACIWRTRLKQDNLAITFAEGGSAIQAIDKSGSLLEISMEDGALISTMPLSDPIQDATPDPWFRRPFNCAAISIEHNLVAAAQRGSALGFYDLLSGELMGTFSRDNDTDFRNSMEYAPLYFSSLAFSSRQEPCLFAALYHDGCLVVFDPYVLEVQAQVMTEGHQILSCSPDGRTLASGDHAGTIQIYEFETLSILYRIVAGDHAITSIAFTSDSLRMLDLRGSHCNVWEPAVLARVEFGDTDTMSDAAPMETKIVGALAHESNVEITAMACEYTGAYVICGKRNGQVVVYSASTGEELSVLYGHTGGITVTAIQIGNQSRVLASCDAASRILVWRLSGENDVLGVDGPILDERVADYSILQILISPDEQKLLVSTMGSDTIYDMLRKSSTASEIRHEAPSWRWINHPIDTSKLIHITTSNAHVHTWDRPSEPQNSLRTMIGGDIDPSLVVKKVALCSNRCELVVEYASWLGQRSTSQTLILPSDAFHEPLPSFIESKACFTKLVPHIEHLIGNLGKRLYFLNRQMWISSLDLDSYNGVYDQHCCIPDEWFSTNSNIMLSVTSKGDLVYVKGAEIAVIKRALAYKDAVRVGTDRTI